jgi:hypothetical protein
MMRDDPIKYEELPAEHKQKYDEIKALSKLISSVLSRRPTITALGGRDLNPKALLMVYVCPPLQKIVPELYVGK